MSDFDKDYPFARTEKRKPYWPAGVYSISLEGLDWLGLDGDGELYWDGRRLKVAKRIELTWWQTAIALVTALAALSLAFFDALRFFGYGHHGS